MAPPLTKPQETLINKVYKVDKNQWGRDKLWKLLKSQGSDISRRQVAEWLSKQESHQIYTRPRAEERTFETISPSNTRQRIVIDLVDMSLYEIDNKKWILNAVDAYSKKAWSEVIESKSKENVLSGFKKIVKKIGLFKILQSDNGKEFVNEDMDNYLKSIDVKHITSQPYRPQSQGIIERFNGTLKTILFRYMANSGDRNWPKYLSDLVDSYNNTYHRVIKMTPNEADETGATEELTARLKEGTKETPPHNMKVGDLVRIRQTKEKKYSGAPRFSLKTYRVKKITKSRKTTTAPKFTLETKKGKPIERLYFADELLRIPEDFEPVKIPKFEIVQKIIKPVFDPLEKGEKSFYLVKFAGDPEPVFIERSTLLEDIPKQIRLFDKRNKVRWNSNGVSWDKPTK